MKNIIVFLYAIFLLLFSIFSYVFVDSNLMYFKNIYTGLAFDNRLLVTAGYVLLVLVFFIFYGGFILLGVKKKIKPKDVFLLLSVTVGCLILSYPAMLSYDIFNYIATSRVLFFYHENPYIIMPIVFSGEPLLAFMHGANKIALYGPSWIILTGIPYIIGFGNFIVTLFTTKIIVTAFYIGTVFLIWRISKNVVSVILFSLNPLVVMETLISGHNDIVMIFLVLFSFFLLMRKKVSLGILFFILSIFIKYATVLLVPIFLYIIWRMIKDKVIDWTKVYLLSSFLMLIAFLFSPIREEIYPWYAIWFISFAFLVPDKKILLYVSIAFSFSLLFRYVPFMFSGTYIDQTPLLKEIISFTFPALVLVRYVLKKKI